MQIIKSLLKLIFFIFPTFLSAQSTFLPQGDRAYRLVDRLEIMQPLGREIIFSTIKPYNRQFTVNRIQMIDSLYNAGVFSSNRVKSASLNRVDRYNMLRILMNNSEWVSESKESFLSANSILKSLYKTKANLFEVNQKNFFVAINPILYGMIGTENGNKDRLYLNTRGLNIRGRIAEKIGFFTSITDNQERGPKFFQQKVLDVRSVPGGGYYQNYKTRGIDYFDGRGYITLNAAKYIDVQFGYDKNFIGNGYRSLFLSENANSYLFAKLNTKIWKFNFQNLFMELESQFLKRRDTLLDRKYAAMHHLSLNVTKWLNIGLFEGIIFGRVNHFDFQYLNPIIFYRHVEGSIGSPDNALAGIDFKANLFNRLQLYGQLLLDEFNLKQVKANKGSWSNKWGVQLGVKYINLLGIPSLDLQLESNRVRPFTYSHRSVVANYTHYNQLLAHPLGANFQEFISILTYQPIPRLQIQTKLIYYFQGIDSLGGKNLGSNPLLLYSTRKGDYGYFLGIGRRVTSFNSLLLLSYECKENLFIDFSVQQCNYSIEAEKIKNNSTTITLGVRLNFLRREYE
ncbi:MAG: hypothetical protein EBZ95_12100 [Chitinophagia bacterium]|nr:hypothetical protein [Chitinophagia bacterium]